MSRNTRPSFLLFCVDQMHAACLSCAGHPDVRTPNLDRLAERGVRYTRGYCDNAVCTPSRLSVLTGLASRQHGAMGLGRVLPETTPTIASVLHAHGYRTKAVGKLHLQPWALENTRLDHPETLAGMVSHEDEQSWFDGKIASIPKGYFGFESSEVVLGHTDYITGDYLNWLDHAHPSWARDMRERYHDAAWRDDTYGLAGRVPDSLLCHTYRMTIPPELHYNQWIAERSQHFLENLHADEPFFLWSSFPDPHHPFAATGEYATMYDPDALTLPDHWQRTLDDLGVLTRIPRSGHGVDLEDFDEAGLRAMLAQTYGMISHVDACIGQVLEQLEASGRIDDTVIGFISDHGDYLGRHHLICKGLFPFEDIMRVPFLLAAPGTIQPGRSEDGIVSLLDLAPTILDYACIPMHELAPMPHALGFQPHWFSGTSLRGNLDNHADLSHRTLIGLKEDTIYALPGSDEPLRLRCFYRGRYKLILCPQTREFALFDLERDPSEQHDLWHDPAHADLARELLADYALEAARTEYAGLGKVSRG